MKRNTHAIVPEGRFRLLAGNDHLSCYQANWGLEEGCFGQASPEGSAGDNLSRCQCNCFLISTSHLGCPPLANRLPSPALQFNTHTARHLFCKTCGICPFYRPRSNPDGYAGKAPGDMGRGCVAQCSRATSMRAKQQSSRRAAQQRKRLNLPAPPPSPPPLVSTCSYGTLPAPWHGTVDHDEAHCRQQLGVGGGGQRHPAAQQRGRLTAQ